jgi:hypothetical protein
VDVGSSTKPIDIAKLETNMMTAWVLLSCPDWWRLSCYVPDKPSDFLALSLAVMAVIFAVQQYFDARSAKSAAVQLHVKAAALECRIAELIRNSSTHAISRFPDNVPAICELMDACTENTTLRIMVDNIGYSLYSQHANFDTYLASLKKAILRKVQIRLLVYDYARTKRAIRNQYPSISEERQKPRFADFFERLGKPTAINEKEFYRALLLAEENLYGEISGVDMRLLAEEPPALFWLIDNPPQIVFGFRDEFPGTGFSFISKDTNLAFQFERMFDAHWRRGEEHWNCRW